VDKISQCLESVLSQSFQDFEIIVIDDGSTDHTRQVAASFLKDRRVHYVYQPNAGLSAARNTGLQEATGQFVAFLDSDDRFLPDKFALLLASCQRQPSAELQQMQQRQEQVEVKIQQLEQKLNAVAPGSGADPAGKPPAGAIKSLTYRSGTADDRLRIYWADGSTTNLPCKQEQATLVCG